MDSPCRVGGHRAGWQLAQNIAPGHVDPWPVLRAAAKAIGADNLKCVTLSGTGYAGKVGQNVTQDTDWPRGEPLANYSRTINYETRSSLERFRPQAWNEPAIVEIRYRLAGRYASPAERTTDLRGPWKLRMAHGRGGRQPDSSASQRGAVATGHLVEPAGLHQSGHGARSKPDRDLAVGDGSKAAAMARRPRESRK